MNNTFTYGNSAVRGTEIDENSISGVGYIPKPTMNTNANSRTTSIILGSFTLFVLATTDSSKYIFLITNA